MNFAVATHTTGNKIENILTVSVAIELVIMAPTNSAIDITMISLFFFIPIKPRPINKMSHRNPKVSNIFN